MSEAKPKQNKTKQKTTKTKPIFFVFQQSQPFSPCHADAILQEALVLGYWVPTLSFLPCCLGAHCNSFVTEFQRVRKWVAHVAVV